MGKGTNTYEFLCVRPWARKCTYVISSRVYIFLILDALAYLGRRERRKKGTEERGREGGYSYVLKLHFQSSHENKHKMWGRATGELDQESEASLEGWSPGWPTAIHHSTLDQSPDVPGLVLLTFKMRVFILWFCVLEWHIEDGDAPPETSISQIVLCGTLVSWDVNG